MMALAMVLRRFAPGPVEDFRPMRMFRSIIVELGSQRATTVFVTVAAIAGLAYVVAVYASVNIGYALRELDLTASSRVSEMREAEIALRERESRFLLTHESALAGMERVTVVRRVEPLDIAFSEPHQRQY